MEKIKVGIIGYGNSGKTFHVPLLKAHPGYEITMVCSSRKDAVNEVLPSAKVVTETAALFQDPFLDLIVNWAPNTLHYSYKKAALEAGKHVVVEKPFVNTVREGSELITLAKTR